MNEQLKQLIEQWANLQSPPLDDKSMNTFNKCIQMLEKSTVKWESNLATFIKFIISRPTCGVEQRKFLDEIENKFVYLHEEKCITPLGLNNCSIIWENEVSCDIQKVIQGE